MLQYTNATTVHPDHAIIPHTSDSNHVTHANANGGITGSPQALQQPGQHNQPGSDSKTVTTNTSSSAVQLPSLSEIFFATSSQPCAQHTSAYALTGAQCIAVGQALEWLAAHGHSHSQPFNDLLTLFHFAIKSHQQMIGTRTRQHQSLLRLEREMRGQLGVMTQPQRNQLCVQIKFLHCLNNSEPVTDQLKNAIKSFDYARGQQHPAQWTQNTKSVDLVHNLIKRMSDPCSAMIDVLSAKLKVPTPSTTFLAEERHKMITSQMKDRLERIESAKQSLTTQHPQYHWNDSEIENLRDRLELESRSLSLVELQRRVRLNVLAVMPADRLTSGYRTKRDVEFEQKKRFKARKSLMAREARERKRQRRDELAVILMHSRDFLAWHRDKRRLAKRNGDSVLKEFEEREKKKLMESKIAEKERLAALKENNEEEYIRLLKKAKNERLLTLIRQTDQYMQTIGAHIKEMQREAMKDTMLDAEAPTMTRTVSSDSQKSDELDEILYSRQRYYGMAHSIQEQVVQPAYMVAGNLRSYQLHGLQWLISLYNNKLNGILADEMGLGKTVQTCSLIAYLMEVKKNYGPFLIIVPMSTLHNNWEYEFERWFPACQKIIYDGNRDQRKMIREKFILTGNFNVLMTTFEFAMRDKSVLRQVPWEYIIIDEAHRLKNPKCFPESDTRILTDTGLLFLDEIEARERRGECVLYGCYDVARQSLIYRPGTLVIQSEPPAELLTFSSARESGRWSQESGPYGEGRECLQPEIDPHSRCVSLRVTPDHDLFVQFDNKATPVLKTGRAQLQPANTMSAEEVTDQENREQEKDRDVTGYAWSTIRDPKHKGGSEHTAGVVKPYRVVPASELVVDSCHCARPAAGERECIHRSQAIRMLTCAATGHQPAKAEDLISSSKASLLRSSAQARSDAQQRLKLSDVQFPAFLELLGFWIGDGSMSYMEGGVRLLHVKQEDMTFLRDALLQLGLDQHCTWSTRTTRTGRVVSSVSINHRGWFEWFDEMFGAQYLHSRYSRRAHGTRAPQGVSTPASRTRCLSVSDDTSDVDDISSSSDEAPVSGSDSDADIRITMSPELPSEHTPSAENSTSTPTVADDNLSGKSVRWFPDWLVMHLSPAESRLLVDGLRRAGGVRAMDSKHIYTFGLRFRDQLMQILLHCGFSPCCRVAYQAGAISGYTWHDRAFDDDIYSVAEIKSISVEEQKRFVPVRAAVDSWVVEWAAPISETGNDSCWPTIDRQQGIAVQRYNKERDGRIWCVNVDHPDHLIVAQRAERDEVGRVLKQSRPVIVGQCKLALELATYPTTSRRVALTGTPLQNELPELWSLLNFLHPSIFNSCENFEKWFATPLASISVGGKEERDKSLSMSEEEKLLVINRLHAILRPFMLRREKREVEKDLADKVEKVLRCELTPVQRLLYSSILEGKVSMHNKMVQLRKVCCHPYLFHPYLRNRPGSHHYALDETLISLCGKFQLLDSILPKLKATGHRVLIFNQMTKTMNVMEDYMRLRDYRFLRLDGTTATGDRSEALKLYNDKESPYFVFMLSTKAGGLGLNLQSADTVILFDSDWNPQNDLQAQARAHRIGQKQQVVVLRLITESTIEEKVLATAQTKLNHEAMVIQAGMFHDHYSHSQSRTMVERAMRAESEGEENVADDDEICKALARSEEELEFFRRMDADKRAARPVTSANDSNGVDGDSMMVPRWIYEWCLKGNMAVSCDITPVPFSKKQVLIDRISALKDHTTEEAIKLKDELEQLLLDEQRHKTAKTVSHAHSRASITSTKRTESDEDNDLSEAAELVASGSGFLAGVSSSDEDKETEEEEIRGLAQRMREAEAASVVNVGGKRKRGGAVAGGAAAKRRRVAGTGTGRKRKGRGGFRGRPRYVPKNQAVREEELDVSMDGDAYADDEPLLQTITESSPVIKVPDEYDPEADAAFGPEADDLEIFDESATDATELDSSLANGDGVTDATPSPSASIADGGDLRSQSASPTSSVLSVDHGSGARKLTIKFKR